jgi:hypothetical protein
MSPRFEELHDGDEIPGITVRPTREDAVRFCGFAWIFPEFFFDIEAARARGLAGTLIPGPLKLGAFLRAAEEWLGEAGYVRHVRAAHRQPDLSGSELRVAGRIARVFEEDGCRRADLELNLLNIQGQSTVRGFVTVEFF